MAELHFGQTGRICPVGLAAQALCLQVIRFILLPLSYLIQLFLFPKATSFPSRPTAWRSRPWSGSTAQWSKNNIRAHLGAMQNRFENTVTNLSIQAENLQAAESRISGVDVALEMTELIRSQILTQAGTAMLAQANAIPQMLAGLLRE